MMQQVWGAAEQDEGEAKEFPALSRGCPDTSDNRMLFRILSLSYTIHATLVVLK
jgi:hypothetical protein